MNNITLGRRIKEARLAKKMTQSEVVGNFITRNMLSQIESGSASPSIKTLEYLSQVLEIPVDQLILSEEKSKEHEVCLTDSVSENYLELKKEFLQEKYELHGIKSHVYTVFTTLTIHGLGQTSV